MNKIKLVNERFVECPRCGGDRECENVSESGNTKYSTCEYCNGKGKVKELIVRVDADSDLNMLVILDEEK